jgi:hypothetical protein
VLVPHEILADTFDQLRVCGDGRRECVVYWTSATDETDRVTEVVHPQHTASALGDEVDSAWVNEFFLDLRHRRRTVRVQVHTHPGRASHSEVDDGFALAPATGFISLVLPDFATGAPGLAQSHLVVMKPDGAWQAVPPAELLAVEH